MAYCTNCKAGVVWAFDEDELYRVPLEIEPTRRGNYIMTDERCKKIPDAFTLLAARELFDTGELFLYINHKDICLNAKFEGE